MIYQKKADLEHLFKACFKVFGFSKEDILLKKRYEPLASVRQILIGIAAREHPFPKRVLAEAFKRGRDDISYSVRSHQERIETDKQYRLSYEAIKKELETTHETT